MSEMSFITSDIWTLGPQSVVLEELCHWERGLRFQSLVPFSFTLSASCLWYKMCILNFLLLQLCRQS